MPPLFKPIITRIQAYGFIVNPKFCGQYFQCVYVGVCGGVGVFVCLFVCLFVCVLLINKYFSDMKTFTELFLLRFFNEIHINKQIHKHTKLDKVWFWSCTIKLNFSIWHLY